MKLSQFASIIVLIFAAAAVAQPPTIQWQETYGGPNDEECNRIIATQDGGFALAGETNSFGFGVDAYLVKINAGGDTLWTRTYGGNSRDAFEDGTLLPDGGLLLVGCADSTYGLAVRTDAQGVTLWNRTYTWASMGYWGGFSSVTLTADGNISVAGMTMEQDTTASFLLVKMDLNGDTLWTRKYQANDTLWSVCMDHIQTMDGGYALAGTIGTFDQFGNPVEDAWLVRTDSLGDMLWNQIFGGPGNQEFHSVEEIPGQGFSMAWDNQTAAYHFWLVNTDGQGNELHNRWYGGPNSNCRDHIFTTDLGYLLVGRIFNNDPDHDVWALKTDANGDSIWSFTVGGGSNDRAYSVLQRSDLTCAIGGYTASSGNGGRDMFVIKTGPVQGITESRDLGTPEKFILMAPSPNPFNSTTVLSYELRAPSQVSLKVFDTAGRLVTTLVEQRQTAGTHQVTFDASGLASGIYLAKLEAGDFTAAQKLILLK